jgi:hypothetical protein
VLVCTGYTYVVSSDQFYYSVVCLIKIKYIISGQWIKFSLLKKLSLVNIFSEFLKFVGVQVCTGYVLFCYSFVCMTSKL